MTGETSTGQVEDVSLKKLLLASAEQVLWLYCEPHQGFNVTHFTDPLRGRMLYVDDSQPRYIGDVFLPWHRRHWAETPTQPGDAFVRAAHLDRDAVFLYPTRTHDGGACGYRLRRRARGGVLPKAASKSANIGTDVGWRVHYGPHLPGWYETNGRAIGKKRKQAAKAEQPPKSSYFHVSLPLEKFSSTPYTRRA